MQIPITDGLYNDQNKDITQNLSSIGASVPLDMPNMPINDNVIAPTTPSSIYIQDNRKVRAASGNAMVPGRDYKYGTYPTATAVDIIRRSKMNGQDPWTPLGVAFQETGMGKVDPDNPGHVADVYPGAISDVDNMVKAIISKRKYAKSLGYNDEPHQIQMYNGMGNLYSDSDVAYNLSTGQGGSQKSWYGVPIPSGGKLSMKQNPLYGKEIIDIRDNILKKNPDLQNMVDTTNTGIPAIVKNTEGSYMNNQPKNNKAVAFSRWLNNRNNKPTIQSSTAVLPDSMNMTKW